MNAIRYRTRRVWLPLLGLLGTVLASNALAATFVVTSTADTAGSTCSTGCTLRQAINAANLTSAADVIHFSFRAAAGPEILIQPGSALPTIVNPLTLDGYSATNTSVNTLAEGSNAVLRIRIDGANAGGSAQGLSVCANGVTVKGLSVTSFAHSGLTFGRNQDGQNCGGVLSGGVVVGNFIGLTVNGLGVAGNGTSGVFAVASQVRIGGALAEERNVVAANSGNGVQLSSAGSAASTVLGNLIGTDKSGTLPRANGLSGVRLTSGVSPSVIGTAAAPNRIAHNGSGISVTSSTTSGQTLFANRIHDNAGLGIDLGADGITLNDVGGGDGDTGANGLQNFPEITAAGRTDTGVSANLTLEVSNATAQNYRIALYASAACDGTHGEGEQLLTNQLRALSTSNESIVMGAVVDPLPPGTQLTATATAPDGSTSEFSQCFPLDPPPLIVNSTADPGADGCNATECTLREAITAANANANENIIEFAIPTPATGELLIQPTTPLPTITAPVLIDGYSQQLGTLTSVNTDPVASNAVLRVRVDGALAGASTNGFAVCASNTAIQGLSITGFARRGIVFGLQANGDLCNSTPSGGSVSGNFIGLATNGATAAGNGDGVVVQIGNPLIGGTDPGDRNVISGNSGGVIFNGASVNGAQVLNNLIGTDAGGTLNHGNFFGVGFGGAPVTGGPSGVTIGSAQAPNRIAFNEFGIATNTLSGNGNRWLHNYFSGNVRLGIDLEMDGRTLNDVNDDDTGPNGLQNFPVLSLAQRTDQGLRIAGTIDAPGGFTGGYTIGVYASVGCDGSGFGEGERFLGSFDVILSFGSGENFIADLATDDPLPPGTQITTTATLSDSTSEFSECIAATDPPPGFVVNSTADPGDGTCNTSECTLREAINAANALSGADLIRFDIQNAGAGPFVITPTTQLPTITDAVTIDGYTQEGSSANTDEAFSNAVILIHLDDPGSLPVGLATCADEVVIRGLSITGFGSAIRTKSFSSGTCSRTGDDVTVQGNVFGLTPDGSVAGAQGGTGVLVESTRALIGGEAPADRNAFGNLSTGVQLSGQASSGALVLGNLFGTDASGAISRPNRRAVDLAQVGGVVVGTVTAPNRIAFSNSEGIFVGFDAIGNTLFANEFSGTVRVPIDLERFFDDPQILTPNDPDDPDTGGNGLQNFPELTAALAGASDLTVQGSLDVPVGTSNAPYTIALYENAVCDASGNGEGEIFLGAQTVNLSNTAQAQLFNVVLSGTPPALGRVITSTATAPDGSTSEFSACTTVTLSPEIFANGFEG